MSWQPFQVSTCDRISLTRSIRQDDLSSLIKNEFLLRNCGDFVTLCTRKETSECIAFNATFTRRRKWFRICPSCFAKFIKFILTQQLSKLHNLVLHGSSSTVKSVLLLTLAGKRVQTHNLHYRQHVINFVCSSSSCFRGRQLSRPYRTRSYIHC